MRVISRTTISPYERDGIDIHSLRKELNVDALMEGSVRVETTHVRVIAQLTDTTDGSPLWTSTFEYDKAGLSDAARDLAGKIVRSFEIELKPIRRALIRPHSHLTAARHYSMRAARTVYSEPLKGVELYRAAVSVDPNYALAWAALALSLVTAADWGEVRMGDALPEASAAARRALGLNPSMTEAHQAMARVKVFQQQDWSGAERSFRKAIELDPSNVEARHDYANLVLIPTARFMEAVSQLNKAVALNPGENTLYNAMASAYVKERQFDKALVPLEASQRISRDPPGAWVLRGIIAMGQNNPGEAIGHFERAASRRRTAFALSHLGYAYARARRHEESRKVIAELEQLATGKASYNYEIAMIHAGLGDTAGAFDALARAAAEHEQGLLWIKVDYRSEGLRDDPEFHTLLKKVRLK